jgi:hypothetical protein
MVLSVRADHAVLLGVFFTATKLFIGSQTSTISPPSLAAFFTLCIGPFSVAVTKYPRLK